MESRPACGTRTSVALLARCSRILRHSDPRITTAVYGHLAPGYLRSETDRLTFGPPPPGTVPEGAPTAATDPNVPPVCQGPPPTSCARR